MLLTRQLQFFSHANRKAHESNYLGTEKALRLNSWADLGVACQYPSWRTRVYLLFCVGEHAGSCPSRALHDGAELAFEHCRLLLSSFSADSPLFYYRISIFRPDTKRKRHY